MDSWLSQYGNAEGYRWRRNGDLFQRPLGFCEFSFDTDGRFFEGRADMSCMIKIAINSNLSDEDYRERVLLAWTRLRSRHLLLRARTLRDKMTSGAPSFAPDGLNFAVDVHPNLNAAVESAGRHLIFLQDYYATVDHEDFFTHSQNATRVIKPDIALAKAFVLPLTRENGEHILRIQLVLAHQIADGISINVWVKSFLQYLNDPVDVLKSQIRQVIDPEVTQTHLPPPQEALYPAIPGSKARQRWFWAITRVLRHVRQPLPTGFANPLRRDEVLKPSPFSPVYKDVLDYTRTPVLNTIPVHIKVSAEHTGRLQTLVRKARASMGAGIYAMVALCMMEMYERREPAVQPQDRLSFITGFPLNPRAFFGFNSDPDSMMLAFSDGIALPFLFSKLSVAGRLRLLARQAQRQLSVYQKRANPAGDVAKTQFLTSRGAGLVLANQYLYSMERADRGIVPKYGGNNVQGMYPARQNATPQTCGVSSVGNRDLQISAGVFDVSQDSTDFAADFRDLTATVRARDGEFLFGVTGSGGALYSTPSIDMSSINPELVELFKVRFQSLLGELEVDEVSAKL